LAAVFFVIGGVVSLIMTVLTIPIASVYPLTVPSSLSVVSVVVLGISLICSLGAIHCFSLATKRMLSEAGVRGIVFGALLLIFQPRLNRDLERVIEYYNTAHYDKRHSNTHSRQHLLRPSAHNCLCLCNRTSTRYCSANVPAVARERYKPS
jgi:hypothetical protein